MKRLLLSLCLLAALVAAMFTATPCVAQPANGVIAQERIVSLPQDSGKWYVSVVGDPQDARYREVLNWFESGSLLNLRNSVHFNAVTSDSAIFAERYAANTPSLPMVRLQNSQGVVYSQVCSSDIPMTAQSLNSLISQDVASGPKAQCDLRPILIWRRNHNCPTPQPKPEPSPNPNPDPTPSPIDNNSQPVVDEVPSAPVWPLLLICSVGLMSGSIVGGVLTVKRYTHKRKHVRK